MKLIFCALPIILIVSCSQINEPQGVVSFHGDSHVKNWDLDYWFPLNCNINYGISGSKVSDLINDIVETDQADIRVVWIGINDIINLSQVYNRQITSDSLLCSFNLLTELMHAGDIILSICPVTENFDNSFNRDLNNIVSAVNSGLKILCSNKNLKFLDIRQMLMSGTSLKEEFTQDGLHMNNRGYEVISKKLRPHIY